GNSIMAAVGLVQLKYLDRNNAYRNQICHWYTECLSQHSNIRLIPITAGCESSRHLFQIRIKNRDQVLETLNQREIYPGVHYRDNTEYSMYRYAYGTCPEAHSASEELLS